MITAFDGERVSILVDLVLAPQPRSEIEGWDVC